MPDKLKYYIRNNKKIYTLKSKSPEGNETESAHYKFKKAPTYTRTGIKSE